MMPVDYVVCTRAAMPPDTVRGYRIEGLFLEPEIKDGDTLIVDTALPPANGDLVLATMDGQIAIERYIEDQNGNRRLKDNEGEYQLNGVSIFGVVTEYVRRLR